MDGGLALDRGEDAATRQTSTLLYPLIWEQGIADDWTLVWSPFPLDLRYQIHRSEEQVVGAGFSFMGSPRARFSDFVWRPAFTLYQRRALAGGISLEAEALFQPEIHAPREHAPVAWTAGFWTGPLFQLAEGFALSPRVQAYAEADEPGARYLGLRPSGAKGGSVWRFPLGVWAGWLVARQWEVDGEYVLSVLGYSGGFQSHQASVAVVHFW